MTDNANDYEIRVRAFAFQLWQAAGKPEGRADEFWHKARKIEGASNLLEERISTDASDPNDPASLAEF